jgi:hypothetical protein
MAIPIVIYTRNNFYLLKAMNEKIEIFKAAGLIEYWYSLSFTQDFSKREANPPKILTLHHLFGSFQVWVGGCLVGIFVFICELFSNKYKVCRLKNYEQN